MIIHTVRVALKLLPSLLALRRDRKHWLRNEGKIAPGAYEKNAKRVLDAFISLGPVYIKLGQWLSARADILPKPYMDELAKLQDRVPAAPFEKVRPIIERDLGPLEKAFSHIEKEAISGASLGQVYRARLDGQDVVIKVKRPGIEDIVKKDLRVLKKLLPPALRMVDPSLQYTAKAMLAQFIETMHEEMDYIMESDNLKKIGSNMRGRPDVIVPSVYDARSSRNVLTMEYIPGTKVTDIEGLERLGIDRRKLVIDVHRVFFTMLLRNAIFHADPHPGNIAVSDDGRLILYDYGMVGRLNEETRMQLVRLYLALVDKSASRAAASMGALGMLTPDADRHIVERAIDLSIRAMHGRKPDEMEVEGLMEVANRTMGRFPFVLPKNLALYMRMASIIEGIYKTHGVDFKFVQVLKKILAEEDLLRDAYINEIKQSIGNMIESVDAAVKLAPEMRRFMEESRRPVRRQSPLIPGSIMASAVFVGSAILYGTEPLLGVAGIVSAVIIMSVSVLKR